MKKFTIISNSVLFIAVIVLFVLHFNGKSCKSESPTNDSINSQPVESSIAYVNLDSVVAQYQMTKELSGEVEKKGKEFEAELSVKQKNLQNNAQDFSYKAQRGLEVRSKLEEMQQRLAQEEQNLYKLRDSYAMQIQEENTVMLRKVMTSVMDYLKVYNKDKNYHYILGNSFDGKILFANESLNITNDVVKGLNEAYAELKKDTKK